MLNDKEIPERAVAAFRDFFFAGTEPDPSDSALAADPGKGDGPAAGERRSGDDQRRMKAARQAASGDDGAENGDAERGAQLAAGIERAGGDSALFAGNGGDDGAHERRKHEG